MAKPRSQFTRLGGHVARDTAREVRERAATGEPSALTELEALKAAAMPESLRGKIWEIVRNHLADSDGILSKAGGGPPRVQGRASDAYSKALFEWLAQARRRYEFDSPEGRAVEIVGLCAHVLDHLGKGGTDTNRVAPRSVPEWGTGVFVRMLRNTDIRWNEHPAEGRLTVNKGDVLNTGQMLADALVRQNLAAENDPAAALIAADELHEFRLGVVLGYGLSQKNHMLVREFADGPALARDRAQQNGRAEGGDKRAAQTVKRDKEIRKAFADARAKNPSLTANGWAHDHASDWELSGERVRKILNAKAAS